MYRSIRKILAALLIAFAGVLAFGGCGGPASAETQNLDGTWVFTEGDFAMVGEVKNGTILINLRLSSNEGLYWSGTFAKAAKDGQVLTSTANKEQLETSIYGSQDSAKEFTFKDGKITFPFTMMGVTKTIALEKNSSSTN